MSTLFDTVYQTLKDKLPSISWKLGSLVRTLVADPLTKIGDEIDNYTEQLEKNYSIETILNDPYNHEDALDQWMERLNIQIPESSPSTGTVIIVVSGSDTFTVSTGSVFTWEDDASVSAVEGTVWGGSTGKPMSRIATGLYQIEVEVTTGSGLPVTLASGSPINWASAPDRVQNVYVGSAITGGYTATPEIKAELIRNALNTPSTCGREAILTALQRGFGPTLVDVAVGQRAINSAETASTIYVKQSEMPRTVNVDAGPEYIEENRIQFTVDTTAVLAVLGVYDQFGNQHKIVETEQNGVLGDFGSYQIIKINKPAAGIYYTFTVRLNRYEVVRSCASWLNAYQTGSPSKVITKIPAKASLKLQLHVDSNGLAPTVRQNIADYINRSKLDTAITDNELDAILTTFGVARTSPTIFTARVLYNDYQTTHTSAGSISLSSLLGSPDTPVAMYCGVSDIEAV